MGKIFFALVILGIMVVYFKSKVSVKNIVIDDETVVIDVRSDGEYQDGHLKNAINIPHTEIKERINDYVTDKEAKIVVYCRSGRRSGMAKTTLESMGYTHVVNGGGYKALKKNERG